MRAPVGAVVRPAAKAAEANASSLASSFIVDAKGGENGEVGVIDDAIARGDHWLLYLHIEGNIGMPACTTSPRSRCVKPWIARVSFTPLTADWS